MASDSDHARFIEQLGEAHDRRIVGALSSLEDKLAELIGQAPLKQGALFDLEWAVAARTDISAAIQSEYLTESSRIVNEYTQAATSAGTMLNQYGDFVGVSDDVIRALKSQSFQGFQDIAGTFLNEIATEVYQNTISGRSAVESVKAIRQKINGVYAQSDQVEVQRLVNIANAGGAAAEEAIKQLHSIYAADKLGNNMRRYSSQMVHDSLMQFDASVVTKTGFDSGADAWKYYGSNINDTRDWCRQHAGKVYTEDEIRELWTQNWAGKASGDPFIVRGGYNCRHHWRPVFKEEADEIIAKQETPQKPEFAMPKNIVASEDSKEALSKAINEMTPEQINVINKVDKISEFKELKKNGGYYDSSKRLLASPLENLSTIRHEYGHHIDAMLSNIGDISVLDSGFILAIEQDKKLLGFSKSFKKTSEKLLDDFYMDAIETQTIGSKLFVSSVKRPKIKGSEGISDIFDALSGGKMQKAHQVYGHGVSYYSNFGNVNREIFANFWELRSTEHWSTAQKYFPSLTKRFDEIIKENQ